jgi:hypothetical protein
MLCERIFARDNESTMQTSSGPLKTPDNFCAMSKIVPSLLTSPAVNVAANPIATLVQRANSS